MESTLTPLPGCPKDGDHLSHRVPPSELWGYPFTEIGQTYTSYCALVFDCDDPDAAELAFYDKTFPRPSWMVQNQENRHLHVGYGLMLPVHRYEAAKPKPLQTLRRVAEYGTRALNADPGYSGVLTRNPEPRSPTMASAQEPGGGASACSGFPSSNCISRKAGGHRVRARPQPELAATWICSATAWLGPGAGKTRTRPCSTTPRNAPSRSANATPKYPLTFFQIPRFGGLPVPSNVIASSGPVSGIARSSLAARKRGGSAVERPAARSAASALKYAMP